MISIKFIKMSLKMAQYPIIEIKFKRQVKKNINSAKPVLNTGNETLSHAQTSVTFGWLKKNHQKAMKCRRGKSMKEEVGGGDMSRGVPTDGE